MYSNFYNTMKKLAILFLLTLSLSCADKSAEPTPVAGEKKLIALTLNNKPIRKFEYDKDMLVKENIYISCETNPTDEFIYQYKDGRVHKLITIFRSSSSNSDDFCNPASGAKSEATFEYNSAGQLAKVINTNFTTEFTYNDKGLVEKQTDIHGNGSIITTFEYDSRGNLIKETYPGGLSTQYTYDDKINPYYKMKQRPHWISYYNKSPNNVIKATGKYINFELSYKYSADGYPTEILDNDGTTYKYEYCCQ